MTRLENYRSAMLAVFTDDADLALSAVLLEQGEEFVPFIVSHGLGPLWHCRTGRGEFHESRMAAESLYLAQERALIEIDSALEDAGIGYVVFKGVANRLLLQKNPAIRACHDIDLLVAPDDRLRAARALTGIAYRASPKATTIAHQLELSEGAINIDLHWGLLREGRLRTDMVPGMLQRRRRADGFWMLGGDDALFLLLVHPAFAKHLAGWDMGLHRVADIVDWIRTQPVKWDKTKEMLAVNGVRSAAWATLRWVELLSEPHQPRDLQRFSARIRPGRLRRTYLDRWLQADMSARTKDSHWLRQFGFSLMLHDSLADTARALRGRATAHRRRAADLAEFDELIRD